MSPNFTRALAAVALVGIGAVLAVVFASNGDSDSLEAVAAEQPSADESDSSDASDPSASSTIVAEPTSAPEPLPMLGEAQELVRLDGWLNSEDTTLQAITDANKVTVVQFWTFGCFNCKNTLPHLQALYDQYGADGLEIVGVHAPEFDYEADVDNIAAALVDLDVTWPVALDTEKKNFRSWQSGGRRFWPRLYVVDSAGNIRFDHIGEGAYDELEDTVARLLADST